ncbi:MAG: winged helix-turn-helix transcriptional regulator [Oscillospiraceae bacterium]|nr:winged helix-turn-helix transcriptional regulator [Oscillospiraceae bacterium]
MNSDYLRVFRAFSDERRLQVLQLLSQGEQCACVLLQNLDISQPTLSYHMKILCQSGIVKERQVGPWKYYAIDGEGCAYAQRLLQALSFGGEPVEIRWIRALGRWTRSASRAEAHKGKVTADRMPYCCEC